jgi:amidase
MAKMALSSCGVTLSVLSIKAFMLTPEIDHDFAEEFAEYLKFFDDTAIHDMADIVEFNKINAEKELPPKFPGQQLLEGSLTNEMTEAKYVDAFETVRRAARTNGVQKTIVDFDLDVIIGPMDGRIVTIAAAAGYPVGTVPLGYSPTNGRPYGIAVVAAAGEERKILNFMSAWDETLPKRKPPPQIVDWDQKPSLKV